MNDWLESYIAESWIEPRWLAIASEWYDGQWSMLYAVASTGSIRLGSVRPIGDDGPMTDADWYRSLLSDLSRELGLVIRAMNGYRHDTDRYVYHDVLAFRDAVNDRISRIDSIDPK